MKWIIKHVWKWPISIGCFININNKENNTAVWSSTWRDHNLLKGMEDPPRKSQFPRVCLLLVRLEAHWGFWQCSSRRDLFFLASRQQIPSSLVQTFLNTKKHMFFSHVYTLYKTGIHHHGGETWHLSYRSSRLSRVMFPGARRIYDEGT